MTDAHTARLHRLLTIGLAVALACGLGVAGAATASEHATVSIEDVDVEVGGTATATVSMTAVPDGLSGFNTTLSVDGDAARITGASATVPGAINGTGVADDGGQAWVKVADLGEQVQPGDGPVDVATVTVSGESAGEAELTATTDEFDDDNGTAIDPAVESGTVTVGDGAGDDGDGAVSGDSGTEGDGDSGGLPTTLIAGGLAAVVVLGGVAVFVMRD